jgi:hypothetical protein
MHISWPEVNLSVSSLYGVRWIQGITQFILMIYISHLGFVGYAILAATSSWVHLKSIQSRPCVYPFLVCISWILNHFSSNIMTYVSHLRRDYVIMHSVNCFMFFRSVNFKFVPEKVFVSKELAIALLILHLTTLMIFAHYKWLKWVLTTHVRCNELAMIYTHLNSPIFTQWFSFSSISYSYSF